MVDRKAALVLLLALGASGCTTTPDGAGSQVGQTPSRVVQSDVGPVEAKSFMGAPAGVSTPPEMGGDVGPQLAAAAQRAMSESSAAATLVPLTSAAPDAPAVIASSNATTVIRPEDPKAAAVAVAAAATPSTIQQPAPLPAVSGDDDLQRAVASLASGMAQAAAAPQVPMSMPVAAPAPVAPAQVPSSVASALPPAPFQRSIVMLSGAGAVSMTPPAAPLPTVPQEAQAPAPVPAEVVAEVPEPPRPPKRF